MQNKKSGNSDDGEPCVSKILKSKEYHNFRHFRHFAILVISSSGYGLGA
jgi:hypothetical protein